MKNKKNTVIDSQSRLFSCMVLNIPFLLFQEEKAPEASGRPVIVIVCNLVDEQWKEQTQLTRKSNNGTFNTWQGFLAIRRAWQSASRLQNSRS